MSEIMQAMEERKAELYAKERELADYISRHPQRVVRSSITELAEESGISTATISRFCKKFRFTGYADFKLKLAAELGRDGAGGDSYQDIVEGNPLERIVSAIESNHLRSISDTTRLLDLRELEKAIHALRKAGRIDLCGMGTSGIVAADFYQKLLRIGKACSCHADPHLQITSASGLTEGDVAVAISYSGETPETIDALICAKEQGATTVSLTKYGPNPLSRAADIALFTSTLEEGMRRGDMASRIAQLHVVDILFMGLITREFGEYVPRLETSYQMVKKYRKEKGR